MPALGRRLAAGTALALLLIATTAVPATSVRPVVAVPASLGSVTIQPSPSDPSHAVELSGQLTLGGVKARLLFRNGRTRGDAPVLATVDTTVIEPGRTVTFARQLPQTGTDGDPSMSFQLLDGAGTPISEPIALGRGGEDSAALTLRADTGVVITAGFCRNSTGPVIQLAGTLTFGAVKGRLVVADDAAGDPHTIDFPIVPAGDDVTFAKEPAKSGIGANPRLSFQFVDQNGAPLGSEIDLGRCTDVGS